MIKVNKIWRGGVNCNPKGKQKGEKHDLGLNTLKGLAMFLVLFYHFRNFWLPNHFWIAVREYYTIYFHLPRLECRFSLLFMGRCCYIRMI